MYRKTLEITCAFVYIIVILRRKNSESFSSVLSKMEMEGERPMELSQLEIFVETAKSGSMKKTADKLHIAQSTVSKALSALEADLGFKLFLRHNNKIELSTPGKAFLPHVEKALLELYVARTKGEEAAGESLKSINVGCAFDWFIYKGVNEFRQEHEEVSINCITANHPALRSALLKRELLMAITYQDMSDENLISVPIISEDSFVVSSGSLPSENGNVSLRDLADYSFVTADSNNAWAQTEQQFFEAAGIQPRISVQGANGKNVTRLLSDSESLCILPAHDAHLLSRSQDRMPVTEFMMHYYRLTDSETYLTVYFTFLRDYAFHPAEREFYEKMKEILIDIESQINAYIDNRYGT